MDTMFSDLAKRMPHAVHELSKDRGEWAKRAKLDWEIKESQLAYTDDGTTGLLFPGKRVFYRSDTKAPLSVAGRKFKAIQPKDMLDFYGHMADRYGFNLAIAGETDGGRKLWAMAETPHHMSMGDEDKVGGALFFVTACDGSTSTSAYFTSFRLRCLNQLPVIDKHAAKGARGRVFRLTHSSTFTTARVERDLELMQKSWEGFAQVAQQLANKQVTNAQAVKFFMPFFYTGDKQLLTERDMEEMHARSAIKRVYEIYQGGEGQEGITGTAWGLVNAVTRYMDHEQAAKDEYRRINRVWVHGGREKAAVFGAAVALLGDK